MNDRDERRLAAAHEDLDVIPAMLRVAYHAVLLPKGAVNEAGVRAPGIRHTMPLPSDPKGWDTYRWACDQLVYAMRTLAPDWQLPATVRDTWPPAPGRAALLVAGIRAYLEHPKPAATVRACGKIARVRDQLHVVTGTVTPPKPPTCETPRCTELQQDGRRCHRCRYIKRTTGQWPDIRASVG